MGNQLFRLRYVREVLLKEGTILKRKGTYGYWRYGVPEVKSLESKEWSVLLRELNYVPEFEGNTDRKNRVWCRVDYHNKNHDWVEKKVLKDDFVSVKSTYEVDYGELKNVRMKTLFDELNAEDYILFLKDNGVSCLPYN